MIKIEVPFFYNNEFEDLVISVGVTPVSSRDMTIDRFGSSTSIIKAREYIVTQEDFNLLNLANSNDRELTFNKIELVNRPEERRYRFYAWNNGVLGGKRS